MRLQDVASMVKSNNAGATFLTFDLGFPDAEVMAQVVQARAINEDVVARLYRVPRDSVRIFVFEPTLTLKITIPRPNPSGGVEERDFDGVQQFAPLLDIEIPIDVAVSPKQ